jgi:hypothetical protein
MMNAVRPFAMQQCYAISICDRFIQGLDKTLLPSFPRLYPNHLTIHNLDGSIQQPTLPIIFKAAQAAEDKRNQIQDIVRGMLASQGFYTVVAREVGVYISQAEKTLGKYKDGNTHERTKLNCWGCGGNHS